MNIYIHTLGCKVNQYESQALQTLLAELGHSVTDDVKKAGAIIVNSCAVTAESVRKSRQALQHLHSLNPGAPTAVCGCWSQTAPEEAEDFGADLVGGSGDRQGFVKELDKLLKGESAVFSVDNALKRRVFEPLPSGSFEDRTRALLKIEDGCSNFCSYCIIPYARGPVRSLPIEDAVNEAKKLTDAGFREIVLTGIEISSYGHDLKDGTTLADVVTAIADAAPEARIRLGSLEPRVVTEDFCRAVSSRKNICGHFHLSLQSGCDETLARMKRKYNTDRFCLSVETLRKFFPNCGITADLITGFPGETEEEFSKTLAFIEKCAFSSMHIFPYSVRPGTAAETMEGQVTRAVKQERAKKAAEAAEACKQKYLNSLVGTEQNVLFERRRDDGFWEGYSENYVPVRVKGDISRNEILKVIIKDAKDGLLSGDIAL